MLPPRLRIALTLVLGLALPITVRAADPEPLASAPGIVTAADSLAVGAPEIVESKAPRAIDPALQAVLDREAAELRQLVERLDTAPDDATRIAVQHEIDLLKQHTEIDLLQAQAERMRRDGHEVQAVALEQTIATMRQRLAPRTASTPGSH